MRLPGSFEGESHALKLNLAAVHRSAPGTAPYPVARDGNLLAPGAKVHSLTGSHGLASICTPFGFWFWSRIQDHPVRAPSISSHFAEHVFSTPDYGIVQT
ncbi:hypothetical protein SCAR479_04871 [Seiridium cardinale]|uniref:Uncharacterized protein n=1 Tax=Seiridium cardinale TaxID=138064 RepID=A0ABR2Y4J7_9PEZI